MANERHYTWDDPAPGWAAAATMSGLEFMRASLVGEMPEPPICVSNRFRLVAVELGRVTFTGEPGSDHYNVAGTVQAGWTTSLLDATLGSAVHSALPAGQLYTTLDLKLNLVRPITASTGTLTCTAWTEHVGRRTATASGRIEDAAGKLYAHGATTCMVFPA